MNKPIVRMKAIEVAIAATNIKKAFLNDPDLENRRIISIATVDASQLSYTPNLNTNISAEDATKCLLSVKDQSGSIETVLIPLSDLNPKNNNGQYRYFDIDSVNWSKTEIITTARITASSVVLFVQYQ